MLGPARFASVSGGSPLSMAGQSGDTYLIPSCCPPHMPLLQAGRGIEVCAPDALTASVWMNSRPAVRDVVAGDAIATAPEFGSQGDSGTSSH
jgi:hypothetical protein